MITEFLVTEGEAPKRLDVFLCHREPNISRSALQRLIVHGRIRLNARTVKPNQKIKPGDHITMETPQPGPLMSKGETVPLEILYEDDVVLVLNKPPGIVAHPAPGNWSGTLINALLLHFQPSEKLVSRCEGKAPWPGLVHRLDKDTSGAMVVAKTEQAHRALAAQFERHTILRTYEALIWGMPEHDHGVIEQAIGRDTKNGKICSSHTKEPKHSATAYQTTHRFGSLASQVFLHPRTGRTHQLRVHMASLGCPILGDPAYGGEKVCRVGDMNIPRVMLHARTLGFQHPSLGVFQEYTVSLPSDMQALYYGLQRMSIDKSFPH